jgi:hypothetical protein
MPSTFQAHGDSVVSRAQASRKFELCRRRLPRANAPGAIALRPGPIRVRDRYVGAALHRDCRLRMGPVRQLTMTALARRSREMVRSFTADRRGDRLGARGLRLARVACRACVLRRDLMDRRDGRLIPQTGGQPQGRRQGLRNYAQLL